MGSNYTITDQRQVTDPTPGGSFVPAMEIVFTTKPNAITGKVRVPLSKYDAQNVDEIVEAQAATIERVQSL